MYPPVLEPNVNAPFEISVVNRNGRAIVFVSGEIDLSAKPLIDDALQEAQKEPADVIIDLSQVTFIDSTGINALIGARRVTPGGQLHVVGASGRVRRVLEITGVAEYLSGDDSEATLYGSLDDAIRALDG
jgi:anti-anti-sigma factor